MIDPGYYAAGNPTPNGNYSYPTASTGQGMGGGNPNNGGYGPVYYGIPPGGDFSGQFGLTESRKRNHDALDAFFGDAKRRQLDPTNYMDLGAQFGGLQGLPTVGVAGGYQNGFGGGYGGDMNGSATGYPAVQNMPHLQAPFGMPFPQLKSKNDLMSIDHFLEQLQNTVYEHSPQAERKDAIHGNASVADGYYTGIDPQLPGSPQQPDNNNNNAKSSVSGTSANDTSSFGDTPALTPGSQVSTHSPSSAHSTQQRLSSSFRPNGNGGLYPQLPSANMNEADSDSFVPSTSAPHSGLANGSEDQEGRRRYSGGILQRARPQTDSPGSQGSDGTAAASPALRNSSGGDGDALLANGVKNVELGNASSTNTAGAKVANMSRVRVETNGSPPGTPLDGPWVENMRVIEHLRAYVRERLDTGDFDDAHEDGGQGEAPGDDMQEDGGATPRGTKYPDPPTRDSEMTDRREESVGAGLYPALRAVEAS